MTIEDIEQKIENEGINHFGKCSAEEFNTLVDAVKSNKETANSNAEAIALLKSQATETQKVADQNKADISLISRTLDGGNASTRYGGVRKFNCGGA